MRTTRHLPGLVLMLVLAGCAGGPAAPADLRDPCPLITDAMLDRLATGGTRVPAANTGGISGSKDCSVDLGDAMRGDLLVAVSVDGVDLYDQRWRADRCARIEATPTTEGPGDHSCVSVLPWSGGQARIDALAWVGDDYEVRVGYQLVEPREFPDGAEKDLRDLLAAAVAALPVS